VFIQTFIGYKEQPTFTVDKDYVCTVTFKHRIWTSTIQKLFYGSELTYEPTRTRRRYNEEEKIQLKKKRIMAKEKKKEELITKKLCRLINQLT